MRLPIALLHLTVCIIGGSADAQDAVVIDGGFRFTAVTDRLIRIEYDEQKKFVDERTIAFLRSAPQGSWTSKSLDGRWGELNTSRLAVRFERDVAPTRGSVQIVSLDNASFQYSWGDDPEPGNLRGTARTLDNNQETLDLNCHNTVSQGVPNHGEHCTWGLLSQRGWAIVNETGVPIIPEDWFARSRKTVDISLFMHGLDYVGALKDFFHAAGNPGLPPRYAFGSIFTRWFDFDSDSTENLVNEFEDRSLPLDAWIFDMNWHHFGPWGSFSWNSNSFPRVQQMLNWFQSRGLPIGANTHDETELAVDEVAYKDMCDALRCEFGKEIKFDLYNKTYAMAFEDIVVRSVATKDGKQGLDFSWIDYQQGEKEQFQNTGIPGINPTIVLNMLRSRDPVRYGENQRSLILSRWGGLGNHRYPLGFSGDQEHSWKGLAFLPYFTSTAANVAFNYWSHDTVGGQDATSIDYELSVRWVQVSAFSPVLRFHDKGAGTGNCAVKDNCARVVPWSIPNEYYMPIRAAVRERDMLIPYIYTAAFSVPLTGLALCRPMYYEDPRDTSLYGLDNQYLFGPDMIMSPITLQSNPDSVGFGQALGSVEWSMYTPQSSHGWVNKLNGDFPFAGVTTDVYGIYDVPGLVRQGAVIPMRPKGRGESSLARARKSLSSLEFRIYPAQAFYLGGSLTGEGSVIDDDGLSNDYLQGKFSETKCEYVFNGNKFTFRFSQKGDFEGKPSRVMLKLSFPQLPPVEVLRKQGLGAPEYVYDHAMLGSVITFKDVDLSASPSVTIAIDSSYDAKILPNFIGVLGKLRKARYVKDALDVLNVPYGSTRANLTSYVLAATQLSPDFAKELPKLWHLATAQVREIVKSNNDLKSDTRRLRFVSAMFNVNTNSEFLVV